MRILPVLDLMNGLVVRGIAGRRDSYRPVTGTLAPSADALIVARAIRACSGLDEFYVADLDAILRGRANMTTLRDLINDGFRLMVDAGIRNLDDARSIVDVGAEAVVLGLETCPNADLLADACSRFGADRVIFSLDLTGGRPLAGSEHWKTFSPDEIVEIADRSGVRRVIVLDLKGVGVGAGVSTAPLCRRFRESWPNLELITGGGVRNADDLAELNSCGVDGVLVASALHNGSLSRHDLDRYRPVD